MQHRSDLSREVTQCLVEALITSVVISGNLNIPLAPPILTAGLPFF